VFYIAGTNYSLSKVFTLYGAGSQGLSFHFLQDDAKLVGLRNVRA
jgi:hypothetical protein